MATAEVRDKANSIVELLESPTDGRYAVAGTNIRGGSLVHMSMPYVYSVSSTAAKSKCRCCFKVLRPAEEEEEGEGSDCAVPQRSINTIWTCDTCKSVSYCSDACRAMFHGQYHHSNATTAGEVEGGNQYHHNACAQQQHFFDEDCVAQSILSLRTVKEKVERLCSPADFDRLEVMVRIMRKVEVEARRDYYLRHDAAASGLSSFADGANSMATSNEGARSSNHHQQQGKCSAFADTTPTTTTAPAPFESFASAGTIASTSAASSRRGKGGQRKQAAEWLTQPYIPKQTPGIPDVDDETDTLTADDLARMAAALGVGNASDDEDADGCGGMSFDNLGGGGGGGGGGGDGATKCTASPEAAKAQRLLAEAGRITAKQRALIKAEVADPIYCLLRQREQQQQQRRGQQGAPPPLLDDLAAATAVGGDDDVVDAEAAVNALVSARLRAALCAVTTFCNAELLTGVSPSSTATATATRNTPPLTPNRIIGGIAPSQMSSAGLVRDDEVSVSAQAAAGDSVVGYGEVPTPQPCAAVTDAARGDGDISSSSYLLRDAVTPRWSDVAFLVSNYSIMPAKRDAHTRLYGLYQKVRKLCMAAAANSNSNSKASSAAAAAPLPSIFNSHPYFIPDVSESVFASISCAVQCNAFAVFDASDVRVATALVPFASYFNHSCDPNIARVMVGPEVRFYALRDIPEGDWLCISYVDTDADLATRRSKLLSVYRFYCRCARCEREEKQQQHQQDQQCPQEEEGLSSSSSAESPLLPSPTSASSPDACCTRCPVGGFLRPLLNEAGEPWYDDTGKNDNNCLGGQDTDSVGNAVGSSPLPATPCGLARLRKVQCTACHAVQSIPSNAIRK